MCALALCVCIPAEAGFLSCHSCCRALLPSASPQWAAETPFPHGTPLDLRAVTASCCASAQLLPHGFLVPFTACASTEQFIHSTPCIETLEHATCFPKDPSCSSPLGGEVASLLVTATMTSEISPCHRNPRPQRRNSSTQESHLLSKSCRAPLQAPPLAGDLETGTFRVESRIPQFSHISGSITTTMY